MAEENNNGNNDIVTLTKQELEEFKNSIVAKNTKKSMVWQYEGWRPGINKSIDNFDIDKSGGAFEEVLTMLSLKNKDLKKKGLGSKPNAAQPVEEQDIEKIWASGAIGLENARSLVRLVCND
ncbi:hypothetical protein AC249_AIPGENE19403 [Exaiptasia diaphana]|nr:hypothetical protein AC249_AIPGENE19403 [Exaiptasia diaphana]